MPAFGLVLNLDEAEPLPWRQYRPGVTDGRQGRHALNRPLVPPWRPPKLVANRTLMAQAVDGQKFPTPIASERSYPPQGSGVLSMRPLGW